MQIADLTVALGSIEKLWVCGEVAVGPAAINSAQPRQSEVYQSHLHACSRCIDAHTPVTQHIGSVTS